MATDTGQLTATSVALNLVKLDSVDGSHMTLNLAR